MNDIAIDATTGDVAVKTMIRHIMPDLNENGILKSVHRVLEGYDGPKISTRLINGRIMSVATLGLCHDILEKMSGPRWRTWREESGQSFKQALRERVERACSSAQTDGPQRQPVGCFEQETRASVLQNALRSINIDAFIRIDEDSMKASIIDTIRVICPKASPENAAHMLTRFLEDENGDGTTSHVLGEQGPTPISDRIDYIKINGKGNTTPVCDAKTLIEIIWLLPSRAAKEFRRQSAHTISRVLGGDTSLCDEIDPYERRYRRKLGDDFVRSSEEVGETMAFVLQALDYGYLRGVDVEKLTLLLSAEGKPVQILHKDQDGEEVAKRLEDTGSGLRGSPEPSTYSAVCAFHEDAVLHVIDASHKDLGEDDFNWADARELKIPKGWGLLFHSCLVHAGGSYVMVNGRLHFYLKMAHGLLSVNGKFKLVNNHGVPPGEKQAKMS